MKKQLFSSAFLLFVPTTGAFTLSMVSSPAVGDDVVGKSSLSLSKLGVQRTRVQRVSPPPRSGLDADNDAVGKTAFAGPPLSGVTQRGQFAQGGSTEADHLFSPPTFSSDTDATGVRRKVAEKKAAALTPVPKTQKPTADNDAVGISAEASPPLFTGSYTR